MASAYWREREEENRRHLISTEKEMAAHTGNVYEQMMRSAQKEIDSFYQRYATKEGITLAEAKQRISKADMDYLSKQAAKYVGDAQKDMKAGTGVTSGYFSKQANDEMRLYNATMKINRLEYLKGEIGSHLVNGFDELNRYFDGKFTEQAMEEFRRRAVILGDTVPANLKTRAEQIVNGDFRNASYSDRLWQHQDMLRLEIGRQLEQGLLRGAGSKELAREIRKIFGGSQANAERLMRTEMCRISTEVARAHYEKNGNTHFEYMALGMNPCPICEALDGKIFPVSDMEAGLNAPPMHPNCHCSTGPAYSEDEEKLYNDWLESGAAADGVTLEEFEGNIIDYMGSANAKEKAQTPFGELTLKQFKKYEHNIWTEDNSRETRRTAKVIDDLVRSAKELMPSGASVPRIIIVDSDRLGKGRYGGYDYKTDAIYYPNAYESIGSIRKILESGYFGGTSPETLILHETGHKDHWDQARHLYKANPKKYNSVEDAKHYLDDSRREALVRKRYDDPDFLVRNVSENADVGLSRNGTINEFQADYYVRQCQGTITDELKGFLGEIDNDALTK